MNHCNLTLRIVLLALLTFSLGACVSGYSMGSIANRITVHNGYVSICGSHASSAVITISGNLRIAGTTLPLTTPQRLLTRRYYNQVQDIVHQGMATGKAGAAMAGKVIGAVITGLASGDTDRIDHTANLQTMKIETAVAKICADLQAIQNTQKQITAQIPAFAPYTVIDSQRVTDCRSSAPHPQELVGLGDS